jgi:hypothetical protein
MNKSYNPLPPSAIMACSVTALLKELCKDAPRRSRDCSDQQPAYRDPARDLLVRDCCIARRYNVAVTAVISNQRIETLRAICWGQIAVSLAVTM